MSTLCGAIYLYFYIHAQHLSFRCTSVWACLLTSIRINVYVHHPIIVRLSLDYTLPVPVHAAAHIQTLCSSTAGIGYLEFGILLRTPKMILQSMETTTGTWNGSGVLHRRVWPHCVTLYCSSTVGRRELKNLDECRMHRCPNKCHLRPFIVALPPWRTLITSTYVVTRESRQDQDVNKVV